MPRNPSLRQILFIASQVPRYGTAGFGSGRAEFEVSLAVDAAEAEAAEERVEFGAAVVEGAVGFEADGVAVAVAGEEEADAEE